MKNSINKTGEKERRLVTILFADLSGFTALSENLDPEELSDLVNVCFGILNRVITTHGGTIHKYEGDSVLAIFGLPNAHEDDPERGIRAALEMMERMPEINKALSEKSGITCALGLHAGLNLGTVFAGAIGSKEKKEYTIIGEAVNMASRLMDAAKSGEVLVSGRVFRQTRYLFEYEPLKPITVKGISKPVHTYQPLRLKEKPEPKRGIKGLHSSLVGREKEFSLLREKIHMLEKERKSGVVFLLGEAGIGKSRLLEELRAFIVSGRMNITVLDGRCLSYGESMTYFPILEMMKQFFRIKDQDVLSTIREEIMNKCKKLLPGTYQEVIPYIYYLFSVPLTAAFREKVRHLDAQGLNLRISMALKELLRVSADERPMLLVIEDYHWIDSASLGVIRFFFDTPHAIPLLILCLSRIEKESDGYRVKEYLKDQLQDDFTEINLQALPIDSCKELFDNLLTLSDLPVTVKSDILNKAEGNPLYIEEILRSLIDHGSLIQESGVWKTTEQLAVSGIPDTIHELIVARLDRLDPELKDLLQKAAVIGRSFLVPLVERLTKINALMLSVHLATLEEFEYIRLLAKEPELEYIFRHPLVQEVAYDTLPKKYRRELHRCVAEIIEDVLSPHLSEFTEILAHHYSLSDVPDKAMEWLMKAGRRARERYAHEESIKYFKEAIVKAQTMKVMSDHQKKLQQEAHEALGDVYVMRGAYDDALREYECMCEQIPDRVAQAIAKHKKAKVYFHQSDYDVVLKIIDDVLEMLTGTSQKVMLERAEAYLTRSSVNSVKGFTSDAQQDIMRTLDIIERVETSDRAKQIKASGLINLGGIYRVCGDYDKAIDVYEQSKAILTELDDKQNLANVTHMLGVVYHKKGDSRKAIDLNESGLAILEEIGDKKGIGTACINLGIMYYYSGENERALKLHQKGLQISTEIGNKRGMGMAYSNIAIAYLHDNEFEKAHDYFDKYLVISEEIGDMIGISAALGNLAILYIKTAEYDKAEEHLLRTEKILQKLGNKELLLTAYVHLAEAKRLQMVSLEDALRYVDKAWQLAEEIDAKPGKADCHFSYAKIHAMSKHIVKAQEHIAKAEQCYREVGRFNMLRIIYRDFAEVLKNIGEKELASAYDQKAADSK